jgi:hypothetical protein
MVVVTLLIVAVGLGLCAGIPLLISESRWRWRWQEIEAGRIPVDSAGGVYREGASVPQHLKTAPSLIKLAAYSCFLFGQMFVPGLFMGLFGLMALGVGVVSIPGLVTAAKLYSTGFALLRREPRVAFFKARSAVAWALWLNAIVFAGSVLIELMPFRATNLDGGLGVMLFINGYGLLSVAQALFLRHVVHRYEDALFASTRAVQVNGAWYELSRPAA